MTNLRQLWRALARSYGFTRTYGFIQLLETRATANGDASIDAGIDRFAPDDFTDNGHLSEAGARKFAAAIAPAVRAQCAAGSAGG